MVMDLLGTCPECGNPVFESSDYEYDEQADRFWHTTCLPKSDRGYQ